MMAKNRGEKCCSNPEESYFERPPCCQVIETKENSEQFYFRKFLCHTGLQPDNIKHLAPPKDPPDFIITLDGRQIGVEVTEFHSHSKGSQGHPRRQIEEEWQKLQQCHLMPEVKKHSELSMYNGFLSFKELRLPPRSKYSGFAREIVRFSLNHCNLKKGEEKEFDCFSAEFPIMTDYLEELNLKNVGVGMIWEWANAASVGLKEDELITTVKPKIDGLNKPGWVNLSEKWLLVVSGHQLSQHMGLQLENKLSNFTKLNSLLHESSFDKIFIYQYMHDSIFMFENNVWGLK